MKSDETTHILVAAWNAYYLWIIRNQPKEYDKIDYVIDQYEKVYNAFEYENMN